MAQKILVQIEIDDKDVKKLKQFETSIAKLGGNVKKLGKDSSTSLEGIDKNLTSLGNQFRYLSLVVGVASGLMIGAVRSFVETSAEAEEAVLGLAVETSVWGRSQDRAMKLVNDLTNTGLIPFGQAAMSVRNLMGTGLDMETVEKAMWSLMDRSVVAREAQYDMGTAVLRTTEGIRYTREQLADATLIQGLFNKGIEEAERLFDKEASKLSELEKSYGAVNVLIQDSAKYTGLHAEATVLYGGILGKATAAVYDLKNALGVALKPIIALVAGLVTALARGVQWLGEHFKDASAMIIATVVGLTLATAAISMFGALLPMTLIGLIAFQTVLGLTAISLGKFVLIIGAVVVALAILSYFILKATDRWDKFKLTIGDITEKVTGMTKPINDLGNNMEEMSSKTRKQLAKIDQQIKYTTQDFVQSMGEWVRSHDKTVDSLKSQIRDLEATYKDALSEIKGDYDDSMSDIELRHARKVEDLTRQINEEVSKGIWADETRIRELNLALKRENEDYDRAKNKEMKTMEEQTADTTAQYNKRLAKLQEELDEELVLLEKHKEYLDFYRIQPILDEIEKMTEQHRRRMEQLNEQRNEVVSTYEDQQTAIGGVVSALENELSETEKTTQKFREMLKTNAQMTIDNLNAIKDMGIETTREMNSAIYQAEELQRILERNEQLSSAGPRPGTWDYYQQSLQQERADWPNLPQSSIGMPSASGITVNINNPSIQNSSDIRNLTNSVVDAISEQFSWIRFK